MNTTNMMNMADTSVVMNSLDKSAFKNEINDATSPKINFYENSL